MKKTLLTSKNITIAAGLLGMYLIVSGVSWMLFSYLRDGASPSPIASVSEGRSRIDPALPKTEECPMNGKMYTDPEKQIWEKRRPITAVIENHVDSRPQSGLGSADIVYEVVAEGGITRFLGIMYCGIAKDDMKLSPIRSARVYLVNWAAEYGKDPLFLHVGGANNICSNCPRGVKPVGQVSKEVDAFKMLDTLGWRGAKGNAFDGGTNVGFPIVIRDQYRLGEKAAWEHSVVAFTDKIQEEAANRGYAATDESGKAWDSTFTAWQFVEDTPLSTPKATDISFEFWSNKPDFDVEWKYDAQNNRYLRFNGGTKHIDHELQEQISAKNIVIQFVAEKGPVDDEGHMFYQVVGKGNGIIFQNGNVENITWEKKSQSDRTRYFGSNGKEVLFVKGEIWIEGIPDGNDIAY
jgi:Protein of unknown function (DUF3048) C-terminal domain/Protein of unknown function (DUF3048) N-terminal domain